VLQRTLTVPPIWLNLWLRSQVRHASCLTGNRGVALKLSYLASAAALVSVALPAAAQDHVVTANPAEQTPSAIAKAFGSRELIRQISLSPDGTKVAIVAPNGPRGAQVMIADPLKGGDMTTILRADGDPERITSCGWVTDTRLVCNIFFVSDDLDLTVGVTRMLALNVDGSGGKMLSADTTSRSLYNVQSGGGILDWQADGKGGVLLARNYIPENTIGTRLASDAEGLGVERVNAISLQRTQVETARQYAADYISDGLGTVRLMGIMAPAPGGQASDRISYSYRKPGARDWILMGAITRDIAGWQGFNPIAVDPATNVAFGFDRLDGRQALYKVALDGSLKRDLVLAHPQVDIDGLVTIGRQHRVVGVSYATEARTTEFFDPELKALRASLGRALKATTLSFVDASADEKTLLLYAGGETDPGRYYLYNKTAKELTEVLSDRPALEQRRLGTMRAISYPAADGTMIPGYLTLPPGSDGKNLPAIVMPHGGPGARDEWGFDWLSQFFVARGFAVLQPNFRGSSGYGVAWFQKNGMQSWRTAVGDVNDAGRWLQSQGIAASGKLAIVGWSYGGYAALQSSVLDASLYKAIVAIAPLTDFGMWKDEFLRFQNHAVMARHIGSGPHIREGSPTQNAAAIKAPVLLFHGDRDLNVGIEQSRVMARRLKEAGKTVELVEFKKLDHQLDDSAVRTQMLEKSDAFLRASLGLAAP
jgi:dienelactone hydrolase